MTMRDLDLRKLQQRIAAEFRRDKKKSIALGLLLLVAVIMAIHLASEDSSPSRARAAAKAVVRPIRTEGPSTPAARESGTRARWLSKQESRSAEITRDIFAPNPAYFPPEQKPRTEAKVVREPGKGGATSKPAGPPVPDPKEVERTVLAQAGSLEVQSTIASDDPTAIINGVVLRRGDWINGFRVVEITAGACVVAKKGVKVTLRMKR